MKPGGGVVASGNFLSNHFMNNLVMRKSFFLFFLLLALCACTRTDMRQVVKTLAEQPVDTAGFTRRTIQTVPFSALVVDCFADVTYHQDTTRCCVVIQAPKSVSEGMRADVSEGVLRIGLDSHYRMPKNVVAVCHVYAPAVGAFELNGGKCLRLGRLVLQAPLRVELNGVGTVTSDELHAPAITAMLDGAGTMDLDGIDTPQLRAELNGVGDIFLGGRTAHKQIMVNGEGNVDTTNLVTVKQLPISN